MKNAKAFPNTIQERLREPLSMCGPTHACSQKYDALVLDRTQSKTTEIKKVSRQEDRVEVRQVTVLALIQNGRAWLIDGRGRIVRGIVSVEHLDTPAREDAVLRHIWKRTAVRLSSTLKAAELRHSPRLQTPWYAKADVLARSFRHRTREQARPRTRCRFEVYGTKSWPEAATRMTYQVRNRLRVDQRTPWDRWAYTVSNNHTKRIRKLDAEKAQRLTQANHGFDREPEVSMRSERSRTDSRDRIARSCDPIVSRGSA